MKILRTVKGYIFDESRLVLEKSSHCDYTRSSMDNEKVAKLWLATMERGEGRLSVRKDHGEITYSG